LELNPAVLKKCKNTVYAVTSMESISSSIITVSHARPDAKNGLTFPQKEEVVDFLFENLFESCSQNFVLNRVILIFL